MKAVITGENDERIGVNLLDNRDNEHVIGMEFDGEKKHHEPMEYPIEKEKRTAEENEMIAQTTRYAEYYVHKERGYETFSWDENLPRIKAVTDAIETLSTDEFERYFGEFHTEVAGSLSEEDEMGISDFISALSRDVSAYAIDVFLDEDDQIVATSDVHEILVGATGEPVLVIDGEMTDITTPTKHDGQLPDARIELVPLPLSEIDLFQQVVVHQTICQIRDYHIVMGEEPPEEYRVLGFGKYKFAVKYRNDDLSMYEDYTRLDADIPGYSLGYDIGDDPETEQQVKSFLQSITK